MYMKVKITYPAPNKRRLWLSELRSWLRYPLLLSAVACPVINIGTGGKAWSVVVLWSIWMVWSLLLSPDLVEYNRISQFAKLITSTAIMLILIGTLLSTGWISFVVPLVCLGGLVVIAALFFSDLERQKQNMMPMLWLTFASLIGYIAWFYVNPNNTSWQFLALAITAGALLLTCVFVLGFDLIRELKRRFHTK